jgi:hypothetical protein
LAPPQRLGADAFGVYIAIASFGDHRDGGTPGDLAPHELVHRVAAAE